MSEILISIRGLKTNFYTYTGVVKALDGIDLDIYKNETLGLVGETGCGKSVTALSIIRLIQWPPGRIDEGSITFDGKDLLKLSNNEMRTIRGNKISMIFQEPMTSFNPVFTIGDQIAEVLILHQKMDKKTARNKAIEMLDVHGHPGAGAGGKKLPARAVGRHAAAGHDRHGAGLQARAAHRRRADDGAGRDHRGADPRAHEETSRPRPAPPSC